MPHMHLGREVYAVYLEVGGNPVYLEIGGQPNLGVPGTGRPAQFIWYCEDIPIYLELEGQPSLPGDERREEFG
jgi:hypothetical protein